MNCVLLSYRTTFEENISSYLQRLEATLKSLMEKSGTSNMGRLWFVILSMVSLVTNLWILVLLARDLTFECKCFGTLQFYEYQIWFSLVDCTCREVLFVRNGRKSRCMCIHYTYSDQVVKKPIAGEFIGHSWNWDKLQQLSATLGL